MISISEFPAEEYFNVVLLAINAIITIALYPWRQANILVYQEESNK